MVEHVLGWFLLGNGLKAWFLRYQVIYWAINKLGQISWNPVTVTLINLWISLVIEQSIPDADRYRFDSVEVKETAFRIDGVFSPPDDAESKVIFFSEVQLQKKENLYKRFFAELFVSLHRAEIDYDDWGGVLIFGSRSVEPSSSV